MEYYIFATQVEAQACLDYINGTSWFPVVGRVNGVAAPNNQRTTKWAESPIELLSGEWAVPRIPEKRLDYLEVPQEDRETFMANFGQDLRTLTSTDFPQVEDPI